MFSSCTRTVETCDDTQRSMKLQVNTHTLDSVCVCVCAGPTVLEVFNTLLKHLRMSVDFELGDGSRRNSAVSVSSGRSKESEERIVQNAIIQTIGTTSFLSHAHSQTRCSTSVLHRRCGVTSDLDPSPLTLCGVSRVLRGEPSGLPASGGDDVHHGEGSGVRNTLSHPGHRQDRVRPRPLGQIT